MPDQEFNELSIEKQYQYLQQTYPLSNIDWKYKHNVTICERSKTVVEPLVSQEFFVDYYHEFLHSPVIPPTVKSEIERNLNPFKAQPLRNTLTVSPDLIINSSRLELAFYSEEHAGFLAQEMASNIADMLISPLFNSPGEAWQWISWRQSENRSGTRLEFAILKQETGEYLGGCGIRQENGVYKPNIWIKESAQGNGYAKEAMATLIDWVWRNIDTSTILYECKITNTKSIHLAASLGFEYINDHLYNNPSGDQTSFSVFRLYKPLTYSLKNNIAYQYFNTSQGTSSDSINTLDRSNDKSPKEDRRARSVAIIKVKGTDQIITVKFPMNPNWGDGATSQSHFYFLSGGKIEQGETPVEAAIRETEEEFGLTGLRSLGIIGVTEVYGMKWKGFTTHGIEYYYLFEISQEDLSRRQKAEIDMENKPIALVTINELKQNNWPQLNWILEQKIITKAFAKTTLQQLTLDGIAETNFYPLEYQERGAKYFQSIRNWCISRDLIWGHRMPVWYNLNGNINRRFFSYQEWLENKTIEINSDDLANPNDFDPREKVTVQDLFQISPTMPTQTGNWVQERKILDTWFSSTLWPLSTLGFHEYRASDELIQNDFAKFYPTQLMTSAWEIFYAWILRMVMNGKYFAGTSPFKDYMCHAWVLDDKGRKMSKSLGNTVDPTVEIETYSADAVRMSMLSGSIPGRNMRYKKDLPEKYRNFGNKLWNVARFFEFQEEKHN